MRLIGSLLVVSSFVLSAAVVSAEPPVLTVSQTLITPGQSVRLTVHGEPGFYFAIATSSGYAARKVDQYAARKVIHRRAVDSTRVS